MDSFSPLPIAAVPVAAPGSDFPEGTGRVESQTGADTYIIAIGRRQITVQAENGSLQEGMQVTVRERNGNVLIQPVDGGSSGMSLARVDDFSLNIALRDAFDAVTTALSARSPQMVDYQRTAALLNAILPQLAKADQELAGQIVSLLAAQSPEDGDPLPDLAPEVRSLLAQLKSSVDSSPAPNGIATPASLLTTHNSQLSIPNSPLATSSELTTRNSQLTTSSPLFRSIPHEVFEQLLADGGKLAVDLLKQLDRLALQLGLPALKPSGDGQIAALSHWLRTVIENPTLATELLGRGPLSAGSLPDLLRDLAASVPSGPGIAEVPDPNSLFPDAEAASRLDKPAAFLALFDKMGLEFEHSLLESGGEVDLASLKSRLLQLAHTTASHANPDGAPAPGPESQPIPVSRQIESVLMKIESLQLLARPMETQAGQEQILSLPLKIDGEWTPLQLRFLHKRQGKRTARRGGRSYDVYLNIEPSAVGAISAHLAYSKGKPVSVSIAFSKSSTLNWFNEKLPELKHTLEAAGIRQPQISLSHNRRDRTKRTSRAAGGQGLLDMKA